MAMISSLGACFVPETGSGDLVIERNRVVVSIGEDRIVDEGSGGEATPVAFSVALNQPTSEPVTVDYEAGHVTTEDNDFADRTGTVTIPAGATSATITVGITPDTAFELDETFGVRLGNPSANARIGSAVASGLIINDDPLTVTMNLRQLGLGGGVLAFPFLEIDYDVPLDFGDLSLVQLQLPFDIYYASDIHLPFFIASGTIQLVVGTGNSSGRLLVVPSAIPESGFAIGGRFLVEFDWSAVLGPDVEASWEATVVPIGEEGVDADYPTLWVNDVSVEEVDAGSTAVMTFEATVSEPLTTDVELAYETVDASAVAPGDYQATSGTVTIPAGQTSATFTVIANGDDDAEGASPETFVVRLDASTPAAILRSPWAIGRIYDDDTEPDRVHRITIQNGEAIEGDAGISGMTFEVTLDAPATTAVTFRFGTSDQTAVAGVDYESTSGERTFAVGEDSLTISVPVLGDTVPEDDETFVLEVTGTFANATSAGAGIGTIRTDDPIARVSIVSAARNEGQTGTSAMSFDVTLSEMLSEPLTLFYSTEDGTAVAGEDYVAAASSLTVPVGMTRATIDVLINGDTTTENDEVFTVSLSATSSSALVVDGTAQGTILNDDSDPGWQGPELVHEAGSAGLSGQAFRPQAGFGPGAEAHVIYMQSLRVWHRVSSARGIWSAPVETGTVASMARSPVLSVGPTGTAVAAWPRGPVVAASFAPPVGWQADLLPMSVEARYEVRMASDSSTGEAVVVWDEPGNPGNTNADSVWAARFIPGTGWQDMGLVETVDGHANNPEVAVSPGGAMTVFTQLPAAGGFTDAVAYRSVGGGWSGPTILDSVDTDFASAPMVDMNDAGDAAVVWFQQEPVPSGLPRQSIYVNRFDAVNETWSGAELVEEERAYSTREPDVAIDGAGNVFVVWLQQSPDYSTENLMANRYDVAAGTWSGPRLLELDDTAQSRPIVSQQVVADNLGNAVVVWIQSDGVRQNVRAARYSTDVGDWLPADLLENIDTGDANAPHLVIDRATGDAMVVWHHSDGSNVNIWANRFRN